MRRAAGDTRRAAQPEYSLQKTHHTTHTLTPIHALDAADVPRLDGTVLSGALVAGDVAVGVRADAVARLPRSVGVPCAVRETEAID